jgi:hypothetical protein
VNVDEFVSIAMPPSAFSEKLHDVTVEAAAGKKYIPTPLLSVTEHPVMTTAVLVMTALAVTLPAISQSVRVGAPPARVTHENHASLTEIVHESNTGLPPSTRTTPPEAAVVSSVTTQHSNVGLPESIRTTPYALPTTVVSETRQLRIVGDELVT